MDERPGRSRHCLGVGLGKYSPDAFADVQRYRGGRGYALVVVAVARFSEHHPEQGRSRQRELHRARRPPTRALLRSA